MISFVLVAISVAAGQTAASPTVPETIVVTGERVRRSLKQTSSSVSVTGQREIESASADRLDQILALTPNLQAGNGSQGPAIRGLDTTGALQALPAFLGGNRARTTVIVDGRRTTYSEFVFGAAPLWDVKRVEVFRSPQTTTQGQNSIAGAIFVETNDPTFTPEARARVMVGNYHIREASAVLSTPLSADVAVRVAGDVRYSRTTSKIADRIEGGDPNHDVFGVGRVKLLVRPRALPDTRLLLTYSHNQSQAPQTVGLTPPFRERRDTNGLYGTFRINVDALTAALHHPLAANLSADVTMTRGRSTARRLALAGFGQADTNGRDWSAEGVLNWSPPGAVKAVAGISRTHLRLDQRIDLSRLSGIGAFGDAQDSAGLFGEATLALSAATLTAGIRLQQDRQQRIGALQGNGGPVSLDYDHTFRAALPKLSLAYDFNDRLRAGLLVQKAYNPGGTTLRFDIGQPDNFAAETLWDYEAFVRVQPAPELQFGGNIFYYSMRNAQRSEPIRILTSEGLAVGFADLFNAPRAHSYGAEGDLSWRPRRGLSLRVSAGLLATRMVDPGARYEEFAGNEFSRSPHFSAAAALDWDVSTRLRLSGSARHHSGYYSDDLNGPDVRVPAATLVDGRVELRVRKLTLFAYVHNLFDRFALLERLAGRSASAEDPRMVGVGADTRF